MKNIPFGGDYNPEQWPEETWAEDMRLMRQAGVNIVTLNVFSWAALQPAEERYDFERLDRIMELVRENGLMVCMGTSTGAHPAWMAKKYPDILRTDFGGMGRKFGGRHNSCPSSLAYRKFAPLLAGKLAKRYKEYDNIVSWHVSNEYGGACYCENCERAFRVWLQKKYGSLEALNRAWYTAFWGHTIYDWEEITAPDTRSEHVDERRSMHPGITLDYRRFMSDAILECFELEYRAIKADIPDAQITTNLMGLYRELDYRRWADKMDFVSWDSYPENGDSWAESAMGHDLMRGIGQGKPFALMEQTPSSANWQPVNQLKRPGVMRLLSYQAMAHGSDTVMFFQMKRGIGGCEKHHGALIDHVGTDGTRVYREMAALGKELNGLGDTLSGARTPAKIGILFDWDNWWALEHTIGPSKELSYIEEWKRYYCALREMNYDVDILSPKDDFSAYRLLLAPLWYMVKGQDDEKVRAFVKGGGVFATGFLSGIVQENDLVVTGGYPGKLKDILGIWVEEWDALPEGKENTFVYREHEYPAIRLCDLLHPESAVQVDEQGFCEDFYRGFPVITRNAYGAGAAYYVATASTPDFYKAFLPDLCAEAGIDPVMRTPEGIEATCRVNEKGSFVFLLNHTEEEKWVFCPWNGEELLRSCTLFAGEEIILPPREVMIIRKGIVNG